MSDFEHLKRLSEVKSSTGIKFLTPAVYPGNHCPMRFALNIVDNIEGLSSLLVGMPECTTYSRLFIPEPEGENGELHWLYVLDSNEVVFGCKDGLTDALRKMDKAGARAILLIATCVPELIGEDIEGIIHEVQPELSARVAYVMLGQFKNVGNPAGSWKTMEALAMLMDAKEKVSNRVNVLGRNPAEEWRAPMPPLIQELMRRGFDLRFLAPGASLDDFRSAPDAALNLVLSSNTLQLAVKMEQDFGIPYIALHALYDIDEIDKAYAGIAERLGFTWNGEFKEERQEALALQEQAGKRLKGLRYITANRIDMPLPMAAYLARFGMEPLLLHLEEYNPEDAAYARELNDRGYDPWVCRMVNLEEEAPILEKLAPDMCFGRLPGNSHSIRSVRGAYGGAGQVGYSRTASLLGGIMGISNGAYAPMRGRRW